MKALYVSSLAQDAESRKAQDPERYSIMGSRVYLSGVIQALLTHGTYDRIFFPVSARPSTGDLRDSALFIANQDRLEFIGEHQLTKLRKFEHTVFFTPMMDLAAMTRLRRLSGCSLAPVSGIIHSINYAWQLRFIIYLLFSPLRRHDALICSSTAGHTAIASFIKLTQERLTEAGWSKLTPKFQTPVIPLAIDVSDFEQRTNMSIAGLYGQSTGPKVLYFGRLSASSKADLLPLLVAFARVHELHPEVKLFLAGDDTYYQMATSLRQFATELGIDACVTVIPNPDLETKRALFTSADIFVSPTDNLQETFGITLIEAMAAGLPAVVADWDGHKDIVTQGETGFRVKTTLPRYPPQFDDLRGTGAMNQPDLLAATTIVDLGELVDAIAFLVSHPEARLAMGAAARRRAKALFDWPVVIAAYEHLWAELAAQATEDRAEENAVLDLEQFGYQDIFSHYPTSLLDDSVILRLSDKTHIGSVTSKWLASTANVETWFQQEVFTAILELLHEEEAVPMSSILQEIEHATDVDRIGAITHVCRLIKYGLVKHGRD